MEANPEIVLISTLIIDDDGSNSGSIEIQPDGGSRPFQISWSNGENGIKITDLSAGDYSAVVTDANGCAATFMFTVDLKTAVRHLLMADLNLSVTPNPFSIITQLNYDLPSLSQIKIDVLNSNGQLIENIFKGNQIEGNYSFEWNAKNYSAGVYYFKIEVDGNIFIKKMVLLK